VFLSELAENNNKVDYFGQLLSLQAALDCVAIIVAGLR
jgi:hypothetical protein